MKTISIHSSRGGTGKTVIATNLACVLANKGFKVVLLDVDFHSPSLSSIFSSINPSVQYWLNDYLNGRCQGKNALINISSRLNLKGELHLGLANPSIGAIQDMTSKSQAWEAAAVKKLLALLSILNNQMNVEYCIFDTGPGVQYSSLNALVAANLCLLVVNPDLLDLNGAKNMMDEIIDTFNKKTAIILNRCWPQVESASSSRFMSTSEIEQILKRPIISQIPCFCDVLQGGRMKLLALENADHPFIAKLEEVANKIACM